MLIDFSDSDFENKVKNEDVSILQFSASWCKPCKDEHIFIKNFKDKQNLKIIGINYNDDHKKHWKAGPYFNDPLKK